jgi:folate-binding protein YgfZ
MDDTGNMRVRAHARADYGSFKEGATLTARPGRTVLRITGKDPVGMLNAILTNEVPKEPNLGVYAALLNPKGRIQTDLRILKADGNIFVDTEPEGALAAMEILGRYAPFSRVKVEDLSEGDEPWRVLGLYGAHATELFGNLQLAEHESKELKIGGVPLLAAGVAMPVTGLDLIGPSNAVGAAKDHLLGLGANLASPEAYETARIEAGVPRFGADITPENFPGETGILDRAVSFKKGCYPGQETVARMHYRGHPNKMLHRLTIDGPLPSPGAEITQEGKVVGRITSIAPLPSHGRTLALGYLSRNTKESIPLHAGESTVLPA